MNQLTSVQPRQTSTVISVGHLLQRKCTCGNHTLSGGECESCNKEQSGKELQRAAINDEQVHKVPKIVADALCSPGHPLDKKTLRFFESRFSHNFSLVRVHTDAGAAASARAVKAQAYTVGRDIVFGAGMYAPETSKGKRLLAHELTHVVQQDRVSRSRETVHRSVADEVAPDVGSQRGQGDATARLVELIANIERVHSRAAQRLAAKSSESGANVDVGALAETHKYITGLANLLEHLREVAGSGNESLELHVLDQFASRKLSQAEVTLRSKAQVASPAASVQQMPGRELAKMPLEVGHPRSGAEIEADRVADQVISGPPVSVGQTASATIVYRQGEAVMGAGEALLLWEASGPGEAEAAIPGVGWIALGATLLVGGVLIGAGYLMSSSPSRTRTRERTRPRTRTDRGGDCKAMMSACMLTSLADQPGSVFGQSRCVFCAEVCRREGGVWPQAAETTTASVRCDFWNFRSTE
jgi:hypothetical protein